MNKLEPLRIGRYTFKINVDYFEDKLWRITFESNKGGEIFCYLRLDNGKFFL
jgi:hypothetical protein